MRAVCRGESARVWGTFGEAEGRRYEEAGRGTKREEEEEKEKDPERSSQSNRGRFSGRLAREGTRGGTNAVAVPSLGVDCTAAGEPLGTRPLPCASSGGCV